MDATVNTLPTLFSTDSHLITWIDQFVPDFPSTRALALVEFLTYCRLTTNGTPLFLFGQTTNSDRPMPLYFCDNCGSYLIRPQIPHVLCPTTQPTIDDLTLQTDFLTSIHTFMVIHIPRHNITPHVLTITPHTFSNVQMPIDTQPQPSTSHAHIQTQTSPASTIPYEHDSDISDNDDDSPSDNKYIRQLVSKNNVPPKL